jgi:hypothetical protein
MGRSLSIVSSILFFNDALLLRRSVDRDGRNEEKRLGDKNTSELGASFHSLKSTNKFLALK